MEYLKTGPIEKVKIATFQFQISCGQFFRKKRILADQAEEELAARLRVPIELLRDYESGRTGIPLFRVNDFARYLGISPEEIMNLHLDLEKQVMPKSIYEHAGMKNRGLGEVIRDARRSIFLSVSEVAELLTCSGFSVSAHEIWQFENDRQTPSVRFWIAFCELVVLPANAFYGYCRSQHLGHVKSAIQTGKIGFPLRSELLNAIEEFQVEQAADLYKVTYLMEFCLTQARH